MTHDKPVRIAGMIHHGFSRKIACAVMIIMCMAFSGVQAKEASLIRTPNHDQAVHMDLSLIGIVTKISPLAEPQHLKQWAITLKVTKILHGTFTNETFSFQVHSPAQSGLEINKTYELEAVSTGTGYKVHKIIPKE